MKPTHIETGIWLTLGGAVGYALGLDDFFISTLQQHHLSMPTLGIASIGATLLVSTTPVLEWFSPRLRRERQEIESVLEPLHKSMDCMEGFVDDRILNIYAEKYPDLDLEGLALQYSQDTFCDSCSAIASYIQKEPNFYPI